MHDVIRAETIGSMLPPEHLKAARAEHVAAKLSTHEFKRLEDAAEEMSPSTATVPGQMNRSGWTLPACSVSYSSMKRSASTVPNRRSATGS